MDHVPLLSPALRSTFWLDDQREVRKDRQPSSACSPLAGGNILLFWTHLYRLPPADSRYQLDSDLCLLITSSFYPIFILFSGSQSHRASPEKGSMSTNERGGEAKTERGQKKTSR